MERTPRPYDALMQYLSQSGLAICDVQHLQTLCWMMIGITHSHCINLNQWGCYTCLPAQIVPSQGFHSNLDQSLQAVIQIPTAT